MKLIVRPKNKKQEKALKDFLEGTAIDFTIAEEDAVEYKTRTKKGKVKQMDVLQQQTQPSIPEWQKQFVRKSIKKYKAHPELLISEKDAWQIIDSSK